MSRTKNSIINLLISFGGQASGLLIGFIARIFFIRLLNESYLGINGLFTNILSMLSLVELGVGPAMVYSLYQALADQNQEKLKSLMRLYRRAYTLIGCAIAALGIAMAPFLHFFMKELPDVPHIQLIFILFVINSSISYFYSYKRSLIIADQYRYITVFYRYGFYFAINLLQIIVLLLTKNFILFLLVQIVGTFLENYFVSIKANKMYPFLKEKNIAPLDFDVLSGIKKNVFAMVFHKIGGIVVGATDNLLISRIVGIMTVGFYSNYQLIITGISAVTAQVANAIVASVGNLGTTDDKPHLLSVFNRINFFYSWIFGFSAICLFCLFQPFIQVCFGSKFLLPFEAVVLLVLNFYLGGMRRSTSVFRDALGLYWYDRYKPLFESVINLGASISLGYLLGVTGIFLGTTISTLTTCFWMEPLVVYKYGLSAPLGEYFKRYIVYTAVTLCTLGVTVFLCNQLPAVGLGAFMAKTAICVTIPNIIFLLAFMRTAEFKYFVSLISHLCNRSRPDSEIL